LDLAQPLSAPAKAMPPKTHTTRPAKRLDITAPLLEISLFKLPWRRAGNNGLLTLAGLLRLRFRGPVENFAIVICRRTSFDCVPQLVQFNLKWF